MKKISTTAELRHKAEKLLRIKAPETGGIGADLEVFRLYHELQVHQIELELQNVELRNAYDELNELNNTLNKRVDDGLAHLRQMDAIMLSQSRLAGMGEMIHCISHQWRQPLNILGIHLQRLGLSYGKREFSKEYLDKIIHKSINLIYHMSQTINDFSGFFKLDKEKIHFDVGESVRATVALIHASLEANNIALNTLKSPLSPTMGYPHEYAQVLLIILQNSQDALLEHRVKQPLITVSSFMVNDTSVVTITDNAGGIPEQNMEHIFEPYFTTKAPDKGTGIGLFMAKTIIEKNMQGRLTVCNIIGGAEFRIEV